MSKKGIRALVYVSLVSVAIWGRDRLSGDGSGARTVKRLVTTRWPARASL